jgi:hypothetical protein
MKNVGQSTPAWSFVGEKAVPGKKFVTPGPGKHQISTGERATWEAAPKWGFGTSGRTDWVAGNYTPGPGQYFGGMEKVEEDTTKAKGPRRKGQPTKKFDPKDPHTFGLMDRTENVSKVPVPGPGAYQHKLVSKEPAKFSFGYKFANKNFESENALGPGQYEVGHSQQEFLKTNKFGLSNKEMLYKTYNTPGANRYHPREMSSRSSTQGTFGKAGRDGIYKNSAGLSPGPAAYRFKNYTVKDSVDKGKGFSISGKYAVGNQGTTNNTPGPGEYNPSTGRTKRMAPIYRFGTGERPDLNIDYTKAPGPGTYYRDADMMNIEERMHLKGPVIKDATGHSAKKLDNEIPMGEKFQEWEGYLDKMGELSHAPKFSFSGKRDATSKRGEYKTPGPGAYDPWFYDPDNDQRIEGRTPIIGTSMRPNVDKRNHVPGPGHYYPQEGKLGSEHRFGKDKKNKAVDLDDPDMLPGPGKYNIQHTIPQIQYWQQTQMAQMGLKISLDDDRK